MAQQKIIWTVLPHGRETTGRLAGRLRISIVASARLTPQASDEQVLKAFPEWVNWPDTLKKVKFHLRIGAQVVDLQVASKPDPKLWQRLLPPATPVAGFVFKDMSQVNLRSYAVRNVLGLMRKHYGTLAVQSASTHPTLLPWKDAHPDLKGMLTDLGTRTFKTDFGNTSIETLLPGFNRFFDDKNRKGLENQLRALVFGKNGKYIAPTAGIDIDGDGNPQAGPAFRIRVLPPDWNDPAGGGPDAPLMSQFNSAAEYTLYQANRFYRREPPSDAQRAMRRPPHQNVPAPPPVPEYDFHRIVASYADYPELLRRLGLVIDCVLPANSPIDQLVGAAGQAQGVMGLEFTWGAGHNSGDDHCPRTGWYADKERFTTRERTSDHDRGLLRLESADDRWGVGKKQTSPFDVYQVDPDGAALKTVDFLLSAQNLVGRSLKPGADGEITYSTGDRQPVAMLRSGGLGVTRHGRAAVVAQNAASAALKDQAIQSGPATAKKIVLFAEDVLRGYRIDVQPLPGGVAQAWHSLCQRHGTYRFTGGTDTIDLPDDEGYVKGASASSSADPAVDPDDHYLHESMFRWTGWSLVVPRPGRTMRARTDPDSGVQGEVPEDVTDEASSGNGLAVTFKVAKGSLPRLRFGTPYRLRARIVDLAGNSLALADPSLETDPNASNPAAFWRFEAVDPPAMIHRARTSEGESLERMVIRSNWNADPAAYLSTTAFAVAIALPASADFEYAAVNERHLVPPKSSQLQCEQHGMFDALFGTPADIKQAYEVAARESGTLYDPLPASQIELITPASLADVATTKTVPLKLPSKDNPIGDRIAPGQYVIHREAQVTTPYLPDPAAGGVALRAMPGHSLPGVTAPMVLGPSAAVLLAPNEELVLVVANAQEWPDSQGFRVVLAERPAEFADPPCSETFADDGTPKWDEDNRVLTLFVAKGRIVRLRYASLVHKDFIGAFGLPDWVDSSGDKAFIRGMAMLGCGWMITPYRPLTLVHATQQPVCEPTFMSLTPTRAPGDQHADLIARLQMHGPSTGKFEIEGEWQEWVDDLEKPAPELITSRGQLGEVLLAENHVNVFSLGSAVHAQMHDPIKRPRARGDRHEFGDTKFRLIEYRMRGTTRFREYLPPTLYADTDEVTRLGPIAEGPTMNVGAPDDPGAPVLRVGTGPSPNTVVLASAPPDDPRPLYTVPYLPLAGDAWRRIAGQHAPRQRFAGVARAPLVQLGQRRVAGRGDSRREHAVHQHHQRAGTAGDAMGAGPDLGHGAAEVPHAGERLPGAGDRRAGGIARGRRADGARGRTPCALGPRPWPLVLRHRAERRGNLHAVRAPGARALPAQRAARGQDLQRGAGRVFPGAAAATLDFQAQRRATRLQSARLRPGPGADEMATRLGVPGRVLHSALRHRWRDRPQQGGAGAANARPEPRHRSGVERPQGARVQHGGADVRWRSCAWPAGTATPVLQPVQRAASATATVRDRLGRRVDLTTSVDLGAVGANVDIAIGGTTAPAIIDLIDPPLWKTTVTLPGTGDKPARVAVREYERYYTDRTVPERKGNRTHRRRVVEERLVYTAFFDL